MRSLLLLCLGMMAIAACPKTPLPVLPIIVSDDPAAEAELQVAQDREESGDLEGAEARYRAFVENHPTDPLVAVAGLQLGRILMANGALDEASLWLEKTSEHTDPAMAERGRFFLAVNHHLLGEHALAISTLEALRGRTVNPDDTALLYRTLAAAYERTDDRPAAIRAYGELSSASVSASEADEARSQIAALVEAASIDELREMWGSLPAGDARRQVGLRTIREAFRAGDMALVTAVGEALIEANVELSPELRAMTLRAERTGRVNPYAFGAILPLSGRGREVGQQALYGMMLAAGLPSDRPATPTSPQIFFRDSAADADRARTAVDDLVTLHQVAAILGPPDSVAGQAAARRAQERGVPYISISPDASLTNLGPFIFRLLPTIDDETAALVARAMALGATRFAILRPSHAFGQSAAASFERSVQDAGATLVHSVTYPATANTFRDAVTELAAQDFDAVFIPDAASRIALVAPALAAAGVRSSPTPAPAQPASSRRRRQPRVQHVRLLIPSVGFGTSLVRTSGRYLQGSLFSRPFDPDRTEASATFSTAFEERHGRAPGLFAAVAFDAFHLMQAASSTNRNGENTDRAGIAATLLSLRFEAHVSASPGLSESQTASRPTLVGELSGDALRYETPIAE